jgi:hypothetical protein
LIFLNGVAGKPLQQQDIEYFAMEFLVNRFSNKILIIFNGAAGKSLQQGLC